MEIYKYDKRKGGACMAQVTCSICGSNCEEAISRSCPECNECVCDDCGAMYQGYCKNCYDNVSDQF